MSSGKEPFNVYLDILDSCLSAGHPVTTAMVLAGNRLHAMQREGKVFRDDEFRNAMESVLIFLRRRDDFAEYASEGITL